jgi:hypothetical protein
MMTWVLICRILVAMSFRDPQVRNAGEAIFDQLPAGRTPGCKIGRERGSSRRCGWRRRLHPPALMPLGSRPPRPWGSV